MLFRFRYTELGAHTHIQVFAGRSDGSLGKCGDLAMRNEEWQVFKHDIMQGVLKLGTTSDSAYEFINEKDKYL